MLISFDLVPWYVKAGAIALVLSGAFSSGIYVEGLRWSKSDAKVAAAAQQSKIDMLKENLQIISTVTKADAKQAIADAKSLEELERIANEIVAKTDDAVCLSADDTDRLRKLWGR